VSCPKELNRKLKSFDDKINNYISDRRNWKF
jgi:hypothetical protein